MWGGAEESISSRGLFVVPVINPLEAAGGTPAAYAGKIGKVLSLFRDCAVEKMLFGLPDCSLQDVEFLSAAGALFHDSLVNVFLYSSIEKTVIRKKRHLETSCRALRFVGE